MIAIAMNATPIETSVIPVARLRSRRKLSDRAVAEATHGDDVARRADLFTELFAQPSDVHVDRSLERVALRRPIERVEQGLSRERAALRLHERAEPGGRADSMRMGTLERSRRIRISASPSSSGSMMSRTIRRG